MKKIVIVFLWLGLFASLNLNAQEMPTWNLARDLQISFAQGSNGVWYFMESESRVHDPAVYRLLPRYRNPCQSFGVVYAGVGCWQGTEAHIPGMRGSGNPKTEVAFNFTNKTVGACDEIVCGVRVPGYLPHMARLLATWERFAIVAWQSPVRGVVKVSARFMWRVLPVGDTVNWSLDKGSQTLRSGMLWGPEPNGVVRLSRLPVAKGDVLYFIADYDNSQLGFDPLVVDLRVTITQVQ
jgi:hypothetical protein